MFEPHHLPVMGQPFDRITFPDGFIAVNVIERLALRTKNPPLIQPSPDSAFRKTRSSDRRRTRYDQIGRGNAQRSLWQICHGNDETS